MQGADRVNGWNINESFPYSSYSQEILIEGEDTYMLKNVSSMFLPQIENDPQEFSLYCVHQSGGTLSYTANKIIRQ